jgi:hypothetical protein
MRILNIQAAKTHFLVVGGRSGGRRGYCGGKSGEADGLVDPVSAGPVSTPGAAFCYPVFLVAA